LDKQFVIEKIKEAAIKAFKSVRQQEPELRFCGYGLYSDTDAITVCPAQNSCIHLTNMIDDDPDDKEYYRWSPGEWSHESKGIEFFNEISTYLRTEAKLIKSIDKYEQFKSDVYQSCVLVLKELREEGFFSDMDGNGVIVFTVSDTLNSSECEWIGLLNNDDASQEFKDWIKTLQ
jgi:hypothetical protein